MKISLKKKWLIIFVVILFCFSFSIYYNVAFSKKPDSLFSAPVINTLISPKTAVNQKKVNASMRLKIPKIGVDALVESVGLASDGSMDVPKDSRNVAWFNLGVKPGQVGSAAMAGHFDDKKGRKAIFYNLSKLNKGDRLIVKDEKGKDMIFVVKKKQVYNNNEYVPEVFSSNSGSHLNLITCMGNWIKSENRYSKRLVIFADLE